MSETSETTEQVKIVDNPQASRYEIFDGGQRAGLVDYRLPREGQIAIMHTETDPEFGGKGLAGRLTRFLLDDARRRGLAVLPYCPYTRRWIARHPDYLDLVPESERPRFQLDGSATE